MSAKSLTNHPIKGKLVPMNKLPTSMIEIKTAMMSMVMRGLNQWAARSSGTNC
jgi:hypothetical protein